MLDSMLDAAAASAMAAVISNPFDVIRTRLQLQGDLRRRGEYTPLYNNTVQAMYRVAREEGVGALQKGLGSAVLWQITQNGIRIGTYPLVKQLLTRATGADSFGVSVCAGAACGVMGAFAASPFVMVKTRLQSQHSDFVSQKGAPASSVASSSTLRCVTGEQYDYKGVRDALVKIYGASGVRGLWQGVLTACQRTMVGSAAQLASYDLAKTNTCHYLGLSPSDVRVHVVSALFAAGAITVFMTPFDVVMTRCYNQRPGSGKVYSANLLADLWRIWRVEGVQGLYKGSTALFLRTAPHNIATFVFLEGLRTLRETTGVRPYTSGTTVKSLVSSKMSDAENVGTVAAAASD